MSVQCYAIQGFVVQMIPFKLILQWNNCVCIAWAKLFFLSSEQGEYVNGECQCNPGWKGKECSLRHDECEVADCNGHGHCVSGKCQCIRGYKGTMCEEGKAWFYILSMLNFPLFFERKKEYLFKCTGRLAVCVSLSSHENLLHIFRMVCLGAVHSVQNKEMKEDHQ